MSEPVSAGRERIASVGKVEDGLRQGGDWYDWGPYPSERRWGTVRGDYRPGGTAWEYPPHDRAYHRGTVWPRLIDNVSNR